MMILQQTRGVLSSGGFDRLAARYIRLIENAGANVSSTQKNAIDTFFKNGKIDGWGSSMRRTYLPIWGAAAPNAIDMCTGSSGTFVGGLTHGAGFVQGNGSTGYFNTLTTPIASGISTGSCMIFDLFRNDVANTYHGHQNASGAGLALLDTGNNIASRTPSAASQIFIASTGTGIFIGSQTATNARSLYRRTTSGFITVSSNTTNDTTALPALNLFFSGAWNNNATPSSFNNNQSGLFGFGTGLNAVSAGNFSLALKNLWETCTGATLP